MKKIIGMPLGLPMPEWFLKMGAAIIGTETELVLKSRRVVPRKILEAGYTFQFTTIDSTLEDLLS